eukprot:TRINITY_DN2602_c0_g2_i1.p2 TRINITY_DN2602_c0_g2~~TRINITY_DN2602_c0_g2_i1.p2  ORF type:complete len:490 (-),score=44.83 TRINITY_DN2602_c0_g2_i1:2084-3553(-)
MNKMSQKGLKSSCQVRLNYSSSGKQGDNSGHRVATCNYQGSANRTSDMALIDGEEFRMFAYKVVPCSKRYRHDWSACPYAHQGEKAKRRDPRLYQYVAIVCVDMKTTGQCARGDACPFCHNVFELWLHPTRYRTQLCNNGATCDRKVCFFAHSLDQLRTTPGQFVNEKVEQLLGNSIVSNPDVAKAIFSLDSSSSTQLDREATMKLANLQQQLLGSEKFQEILNINQVEQDASSKPNCFFDRTQTMQQVPPPTSPFEGSQSASAFFANNLPQPVQSDTLALAQLLAITQKPSSNRFSVESQASPLDSFQSSSLSQQSLGDVLAQTNSNYLYENSNNVNTVDIMNKAKNMLTANVEQPADPIKLQHFLTMLSMGSDLGNAFPVLAHQDSSSSQGSSVDYRNLQRASQPQSFGGVDIGVGRSQGNLVGNMSSSVGNMDILLGNRQSGANMQKFNSYPLCVTEEERQLAECVQYLHLFEEDQEVATSPQTNT